MRNVSLLGLGPMGGALAHALIAGDAQVTVWNRSADKARPLVALGAVCAASPAAAVAASPVVLVCLDSYRTTRGLFEPLAADRDLSGRIVVDLTTGTPEEARVAAAWFAAQGARYLDGAILCGVPAIGTAQALLLFSGDEAAFRSCQPLLARLGPDHRFVGTDAGGAAALDMAWLTRIAAEYLAMYQGAAICRAEGVGIDQFAAVFPEGDSARAMLEPVRIKDFGKATANVTVWNKAIGRLAAQARTAGISADLADLLGNILSRTEAAGHGHQRMAAMVRVLGRPGDFQDIP